MGPKVVFLLQIHTPGWAGQGNLFQESSTNLLLKTIMFLFLALIYTFRSLTLVAAVVGLRSLHAMSLLPWGNRNELTKPVTIFPLSGHWRGVKGVMGEGRG